MKKIYFFFFFILFSCSVVFAQTIIVSGVCMSDNISLNYYGIIDGKNAYTGTGTVDGNVGTEVSIFWMPAPDNLWVLAFSGQPYFQNACNTSSVPGTAFTACPWAIVTGTTCTGSSPLSITGAVVLPVTLIDFTALKRTNDIVLAWKTLQETNNRGFEVQKSNDGVHWLNIGFVNGRGNVSNSVTYQFVDANPFTSTNIYRLKQEDFDAKVIYSPTVSVNFTRNSLFTISDNPGKGIYKLNMTPSLEKIELSIIDVSGKIIFFKTASAGNQLLDISNNANGIYWLKIKKGSYQFTEKIIKL